MAQPRLLRVLPNPTVGVVPVDPDHDHGRRGWVGAKLRAKLVSPAVLEKVKTRTVVKSEAQYEHEYEFATEPVEILNTAYYRERIKRGELIAADRETAEAAGIRAVKFCPGDLYLADLTRKAASVEAPKLEPATFAGVELPLERVRVPAKPTSRVKE